MKKTATWLALLIGLIVGAVLLNFTNLMENINRFIHSQKTKKEESSDINGMAFLQWEAKRKFDIETDSFFVYHHEIQKNEFLSDILLGCNVPYPIID
ncbi:MAG: hypothetical protein ACPGVB_15045, partial [Chitinophagales bacterium]